MDQPYSVVADWLSKFHTWPMLIQALWLVAVPVTVLGVTWIMMRGLRDLAAVWRGRGEEHGRLVYGVVEDVDERLLVLQDGEVRVVEDGLALMPRMSSKIEPTLPRG